MVILIENGQIILTHSDSHKDYFDVSIALITWRGSNITFNDGVKKMVVVPFATIVTINGAAPSDVSNAIDKIMAAITATNPATTPTTIGVVSNTAVGVAAEVLTAVTHHVREW